MVAVGSRDRVVAIEPGDLGRGAPLVIGRSRAGDIPAGHPALLVGEAEKARAFIGEPDEMREAFRLRQLDSVVVVLQGVGEVAGQADRFGFEQSFELPEIVRAVGGKDMQASEAVAQRFAVPCGLGMRASERHGRGQTAVEIMVGDLGATSRGKDDRLAFIRQSQRIVIAAEQARELKPDNVL